MQKIFLSLSLALLLCLGSCQNKNKKASESQPAAQQAPAPTAEQPTEAQTTTNSESTAAVPRPISRITVFVETSGSMAGYFQGSEFMSLLAKLPVMAENIAQGKRVAIKFINTPTDVRDYAEGPTAFANFANAQRGKICTSKSSEIHNIFGHVANYTQPGEVSLLVSDCILSFSNRKTDAVDLSTLEANVRGTFQKIRDKGFAVSAYAFTSAFTGNYYNMALGTDKYANEQRPFYVWALGKKEQLEQFRQQIAQDVAFAPRQQLHIGFGYAPVKQHKILAQMLVPRGKYRVRNYTQIYDIEGLPAQPIQFYVACQLAGVPPYVRQQLAPAQWQAEGQGIKASISAIHTAQQLYQSKLTPDDSKQVAQHSHFIKVSLTSMMPDKGTLHLRLPYRPDEWYKQWSTPTDLSPAQNKGKTLALAQLINGVQEAYQEQRNYENFVDIAVPLAKEE